MKNIILFVLFLVSIFIINIAFYYTSSDYRDFIKKIKIESENISQEEDFIKKWENGFFSGKIENNKLEEKENNNSSSSDHNASIGDKNTTLNTNNIKQEIKLWKWYQDILDMFSWYNLSNVDINANLFDLTNEYPDSYYEYYSPKLSLYFFTTKTYEQVYDIFDVLQTERPFKLNSINNFWEKSFYINFNEDLNDAIRLVILHKWIVFWLKVDKNEYNNIKQKLQNLRNN